MHQFAWEDEPFSFKAADRTMEFIGAWRCQLCGFRMPTLSEEWKAHFLEVIQEEAREFAERRKTDPDADDDCNQIIVDKVMFT